MFIIICLAVLQECSPKKFLVFSIKTGDKIKARDSESSSVIFIWKHWIITKYMQQVGQTTSITGVTPNNFSS